MPALGGVSPFFLWELLSAMGYPNPPLNEGYDFVEAGVHRCIVTMTCSTRSTRGGQLLWLRSSGTVSLTLGRWRQWRRSPLFVSSNHLRWSWLLLGYFRQSMRMTRCGKTWWITRTFCRPWCCGRHLYFSSVHELGIQLLLDQNKWGLVSVLLFSLEALLSP